MTVWRNGIHVSVAAQRTATSNEAAAHGRGSLGAGNSLDGLCDGEAGSGLHGAREWSLLSPAPLLSDKLELGAFPGGVKVTVPVDADAATAAADTMHVACLQAGLEI